MTYDDDVDFGSETGDSSDLDGLTEGPYQRDDFAMLAMQALLAAAATRVYQQFPPNLWANAIASEFETIAVNSYKMADAMGEARL